MTIMLKHHLIFIEVIFRILNWLRVMEDVIFII